MNRRVLMIAPTPFFGDRGCHIRILEEIRALESAGVTVRLATYPAGNEVEGIDISRVTLFKKMSGVKIGPDRAKYLLDSALFLTGIREAARFKPDVIHGHLHEGCLIGYAIARSIRKPLVFDYQGSLSGEMEHHGYLSRGSLPFAAFGRFEKFIDNLPDAAIVSSRTMMNMRAGVDRSKWFYVPDAIDPEMFKPMRRDDKLAAEIGLPQNKTICVFLGLLNKYQGVDLLLTAISKMKKTRGPIVHFLIMGYPSREYYLGIAHDLGIEDCVTLPGRISYNNAPRYLCLGDFAIAPKIAETESNGKVIDYMACGLPAVAMDTAVNRELMGDNALFVRWNGRGEDASENLAAAFISMTENISLRKQLSIGGRKRVCERYSREVLRSNLLKVYDSL